MSRDIRSYFMVGGNKKPTPPSTKVQDSPQVKRKAVTISSDEDDVSGTPKQAAKPTKGHRKKRRISDSDEETTTTKRKNPPTNKPVLSKLLPKSDKKVETKKSVDLSNLFAGEPTRIERPKPKKNPPVANTDQLLDDDFDVSMAELDEGHLEEGMSTINDDKERVEELHSKKHSEKSSSDVGSPKNTTPTKLSLAVTPAKDSDIHKRVIKKSPLSDLGLKHTSPEEEHQPATSPRPVRKSPKKVDLNSSVLSDEERHERKRVAAVLYQKYKNRQSVINPGCKEVPKGKPNCLAGLTFLVTGILESIERDEANSLIEELGGKVSKTVGKRLNYVVVGEEAGPKKLVTAEELGVKVISEDELYDLIREKSGQVDSNKNSTKVSPKKEEAVAKKKKHSSTGEKKTLKHEKHEPDGYSSPKKLKLHEESSLKVKEEKVVESPAKKTTIEEATAKDSESKPILSSNATSEENLAWVDKYKPTTIKQIIGQQGAASNCVKLMNWLSKWYSNHDGKKKLQRPNPWAKNDDGSFYKAALLSGPPGVGKTTTATLVCKELGFDTVEFNASDTRSKKLLKEQVSELLSNQSLYGYFYEDKKAVSKKHVVIMDEVDGMAGNEDRGGVQELIGLIKETSVPIICMCNDRNHPKMRSLVNYCYDLRFNKPRVEQIKGAMMTVCFKEKFKVPPAKMEEIIAATNNDIRQTLNHLSLLSAGKELREAGKENTARKDLKLGPWEVVRKVFSADEHKHMTLEDKSDLFFNDYSLGPLFVQQNYLSVLPKVPKQQIPQQVALAANSLSLGDLIDKRIRSNAAWSLLPVQAMFSSVLPGEYIAGHFTGQINFPGWLGKNSKTNKRNRLAQELHDHTRLRTSGSKLSIRLDYAPFLLDAIVRPLKNKGLDGVHESLEVIKEYRLLREDLESLVELTSWPGKKNPMDAVDGKVKAALTRAYNKEVLAYSYSAMAGVKKKRAEAQDDLVEVEEVTEDATVIVVDDEDDGEEEKLENDALIKAKKRTVEKGSAKGESQKTGAVAGTSKGKASGGRRKK